MQQEGAPSASAAALMTAECDWAVNTSRRQKPNAATSLVSHRTNRRVPAPRRRGTGIRVDCTTVEARRQLGFMGWHSGFANLERRVPVPVREAALGLVAEFPRCCVHHRQSVIGTRFESRSLGILSLCTGLPNRYLQSFGDRSQELRSERFALLAQARIAAKSKPRFDTRRSVLHPRGVLTLGRQLFALALAVLLSAGNAVVCAGWAPTPEARMACCSDSACPMHKGDTKSSGSQRVISQTQADSCCASAEHENSNQSSPTFVAAISSAVLGTGIALPVTVPALVLSDGWRTVAPIPTTHIPKHVLLSVFLV